MTQTLKSAPAGSAAAAGAPASAAGGETTDRAAAATTDGQDRYLTFTLGGEVFALPILDVTEIMEYRNLTVVPMMPAFLRGVINLRGRVVPVIDLAARFGRGSTDVVRRTGIVIVEVDGAGAAHGADGGEPGSRQLGILVDAVNKVMHLGPGDIEPPPAFGAGIRTDFIAGMARSGAEFVIVLDVAHVLSAEELGRLGDVGPQPTGADPTTQGREDVAR